MQLHQPTVATHSMASTGKIRLDNNMPEETQDTPNGATEM